MTKSGKLRSGAGIAAACALGATGLTACGGSGGGDNGSLTAGVAPVVSGVNVYVAQDEGYFAKQHLHVKIKKLNGGAAIVPALQSGTVQVGQTNVVSAIQGAARGIKEPCFSGANTDPTSGHYLSLVTSAKSHVSRPAELRGKTVGVNATSGVNELLTKAYLTSHGVKASSVHFIGIQYPDMPAALKSGRVAAAMTSEPFTTISMGRGSKLLTGTPLRSIAGSPTYSCWNASASWLTSHKGVAKRFAAAMRATDAFVNAHPAKFRSLAAKHLTINASVLKKMSLPHFTGELTASDISAWENAARKYHLIHSRPPLGNVLAKGGS